jgi:pimeloyl-ACP methyl ester carboxylesterase
MMKSVEHRVPNGEGWTLSVFQTWDEGRLDRARRPVVIVPGYGMNSFIFSYHPGGLSLEGFLAAQGFEVWRADLRGQGASRRVFGRDDYGLVDLALADLGAVSEAILARTQGRADRVSIVGCSLGGTIMFLHAALRPAHRLGAMVGMGSPVRWVKVHPLLRAAFLSPALVGMLPMRGTRALCGAALPHLVRFTPWLLKVYMNPEIVDTAAAAEMVKTVEDPNRHVNREIGEWIQHRDLVVRGVNLSEALPSMRAPFLCIYANGDGIVPKETASYPFRHIGATRKALLEVGTREVEMAHADMFVSREAHARVFEPLSRWLVENGEAW